VTIKQCIRDVTVHRPRAKGDSPIFADFAAKIGTVPANGYSETIQQATREANC